MTGKIIGTGSYVPETYIDNDRIAKMVTTSDEWIRERTGISMRHIAKEDTVVSMACKAAKKALIMSSIDPSQVDMILVSTTLSNELMPCTACKVQEELECENAVCMDLNAACSGFLFAYNTVLAYMELGIVKHAIVIGSDCMSKLIDWTDRGTCILFGDGAGAVVMKAVNGSNSIVMKSEGKKGGYLELQSGGTIRMDGREVFQFAVKEVPVIISDVLEKVHMNAEEIDHYILHQANKRIIEAVSKRLKLSNSKFPVNIKNYGNTSSASIPILLDELWQKGELKEGESIILAGFGAGLSVGATYLKW